MKKILLLLILILTLFSCKQAKKVVVYHNQEAKIAVVDSVVIEFPPQVHDSVVLNEIRKIRDSIIRAEFIADSLEFRRITKLINGGYNGFDDRWKGYLRAIKVLEDTIPENQVIKRNFE